MFLKFIKIIALIRTKTLSNYQTNLKYHNRKWAAIKTSCAYINPRPDYFQDRFQSQCCLPSVISSQKPKLKS